MKTTNKTTETKDRKAMLSLLWIFVLFNFTYADILTLYFNTVLQKQAWQLFQLVISTKSEQLFGYVRTVLGEG